MPMFNDFHHNFMPCNKQNRNGNVLTYIFCKLFISKTREYVYNVKADDIVFDRKQILCNAKAEDILFDRKQIFRLSKFLR